MNQQNETEMTERDTGGAALPGPDDKPEQVMYLLDYFAASVMQGMFVYRERTGSEFGYEPSNSVARRAYDMADAMLAERAKRKAA